VRTRVATARDFKGLVEEDYAAYKAAPLDLRLAYHLALGLFHLSDWSFWQYRGEPGWPYKKELGKYQKELEGICSDFGYVRDLANSVKHAVLDGTRASTKMVGLSTTQVQPPAFSSKVFSRAFQTKGFITIEIGPDQHVPFGKTADAVMAMWNELFSSNKW
jgi:hypothetical protein